MGSIFCLNLSHALCKDSVAQPLINHGERLAILFGYEMGSFLSLGTQAPGHKELCLETKSGRS